MRTAGFTLLELLVTLVLFGVLLGMAIPGYRDLVASQRAAVAVNQLTGAIAMARSSAISLQSTVTLCPGRDGVCAARDQWHIGAILFLDRDSDGQRDREDTILHRFPPWEDARLYWRSFRQRSYLQFLPRGNTPWQNGNFLYCPTGGRLQDARMLILNPLGRTRVARDRNGDGIVENASGRAISCP